MTNPNSSSMRCMTPSHLWWITCLDTTITTNSTSNNILLMTMEVRIIGTWCQLYLPGLRLLHLSSSSSSSLRCLLRTVKRSGVTEKDLNFILKKTPLSIDMYFTFLLYVLGCYRNIYSILSFFCHRLFRPYVVFGFFTLAIYSCYAPSYLFF